MRDLNRETFTPNEISPAKEIPEGFPYENVGDDRLKIKPPKETNLDVVQALFDF